MTRPAIKSDRDPSILLHYTTLQGIKAESGEQFKFLYAD